MKYQHHKARKSILNFVMKTDEQGNFVYDFPFLLGAVHTYHGEPIQKMENKRTFIYYFYYLVLLYVGSQSSTYYVTT